MTVSKDDLMYAILAMDSYNHGYNAGINGVGSSIGNWSLLGSPLPSNYQQAGFYATAYEYNGKTVISYRGTDNQTTQFNPTSGGSDVINGWTIGFGFPLSSQAGQAEQFYTTVTNQTGTPKPAANVILTGHSLGGGLAAFLASITGDQAVVFDNMPFGAASIVEIYRQNYLSGLKSIVLPAQTFYTYPTNSSNITQFYTEGEALETVRAISPLASTSTLSIALPVLVAQMVSLYGSHLDKSFSSDSQFLDPHASLGINAANGQLGPVDLHSQSLLVTLMYAQTIEATDWYSIGTPLLNALFNEHIGHDVGFADQGTDGSYSPAAKMMSAIAYSAIDQGTMPFGNAAIKSLFADANTLGRIVTNNSFTGVLSGKSIVNALAEILVQNAGGQAEQKTTTQNGSNGIFNWDEHVLAVDLDPDNLGGTYIDGTDSILGVNDLADALWQNVITNSVLNNPRNGDIAAFLESKSSALQDLIERATITKILLDPSDAQDLDGTDAPDAPNGFPASGVILVGSNSGGTLSAGDGDNLIIGGTKVIVGNGDNIIVGGTGDETFTVGSGTNIIVGSAGKTVVDYSGLDKSYDLDISSGSSDSKELNVKKTNSFYSNTDDLYQIKEIDVASDSHVYVNTIKTTLDIHAAVGANTATDTPGAIIDFSNLADAINYQNGSLSGSKVTMRGFGELIGTIKADTYNISVPASSTDSFINRIDGGGGNDIYTIDYKESTSASASLLLEGGEGDDVFTFNNADKGSFTVVWGSGGKDTFNFNSDTANDAEVLLLDIDGVTASNYMNLDLDLLRSYVDDTYDIDTANKEPLVVIINATSDDKLEYNGTAVTTPSSAVNYKQS